MTSPVPVQALLDLFAQTLQQAENAVANISNDRLAEQPHGVLNHPAWTLGHLVFAGEFIVSLLGGESAAGNQRQVELYGPGSKPQPDRALYAGKEELLAQLRACHERVIPIVNERLVSHYNNESPEFLRSFAPTVGPMIVYLLAAHESYHVAQLTPWRQAAGL
jgi:hypothetical protein